MHFHKSSLKNNFSFIIHGKTNEISYLCIFNIFNIKAHMKKVTYLALSLLLIGVTSCLEEKNLGEVKPLVIDERFLNSETFNVPLMDGKVTVVTLAGDTLAITDIPLALEVPVGLPETRATGEGLSVSYHEYAALPDFVPQSYQNVSNHILLFEDSRNADYDYNDVVLHVNSADISRIDIGGNRYQQFRIRVRGIALGSTKLIGFGFTDYNGTDYDLSNNVRRDYFAGKTGFINTEENTQFFIPIPAYSGADEEFTNYYVRHNDVNGKGVPNYMKTGYIEYKTITTTNNGRDDSTRKLLSFYIKTGEEKLYIASVEQDSPAGTCPFGLGMMEYGDAACRRYPYEQVFIGDAFPEFMNWIRTGSPRDWNNKNFVNSLCYNIPSSGLWRW